ncbi:uncharacterized protein LOC122400589 [Colletes gigas]|uniref:uncharacterized protein LOC122400589 n=1 Tax=Colletes gigas TaxID=935657 RepID=UPI001C9AD5B7|nr:uncharacterized protein LOC122400589 [Colletes gigas]
MYRQFLVRPEDKKYQRVLWRDADGQVKTYELNTITFGLSPAPYLAIRCLNKLAEGEEHRYPNAAKIIQRDFYVDDTLTGASTKEEALRLREELTLVLKRAGLNIRQWASNGRDLLHGLAEQDLNRNLEIGESSTLKTLGIFWNSTNDSIHYAVKITTPTRRITKRTISSEIAKIYDPLGLLGPVIITAKILLKKIWSIKLDWDESLPASIHNEWERYYLQLPLLNNVTFPRKAIIESAEKLELHGFCDASEKAYGACVYLRSIDKHDLLIAKSRVAPLKQQTIPRLELCGALLLVSLAKTVEQAFHIPINHSFYWTDSTIALHWLNTPPNTLKTFVANRVSEIQQKTSITNWRHVRTTDNPADIISRGQTAEEFLQPSIWHHGPSWLTKNQTLWPTWDNPAINDIPDQKRVICLVTNTMDSSIFEKYSSWNKLVRVVARCLRWRPKQCTKGTLTTPELLYARSRLIKLLQQQHFAGELQSIHKEKLSVKAVHLELVSDLTIEAFIAALRRFVARREFCTNLYLDNGTNFVGDNNELRELRELINSKDHQDKERDYRDVPPNRLSSWKHIQQIKQHFWTRWRREYLNELTSRSKWKKGNHFIKEAIVLLKEDNVPPTHWPLGQVIKIHPGSDGVVRAATVKTSASVLDRSVKKLVPLPNQPLDAE